MEKLFLVQKTPSRFESQHTTWQEKQNAQKKSMVELGSNRLIAAVDSSRNKVEP